MNNEKVATAFFRDFWVTLGDSGQTPQPIRIIRSGLDELTDRGDEARPRWATGCHAQTPNTGPLSLEVVESTPTHMT